MNSLKPGRDEQNVSIIYVDNIKEKSVEEEDVEK